MTLTQRGRAMDTAASQQCSSCAHHMQWPVSMPPNRERCATTVSQSQWQQPAQYAPQSQREQFKPRARRRARIGSSAGAASLLCIALLLACSIPPSASACNITLPGLVRVFTTANPDFGSIADPADQPDTGIVRPRLNSATGEPQYAPASGYNTPTTNGIQSFTPWYSETPTTEYKLQAVQTTDGGSFAFTSARYYPVAGQQYFTAELHTTVKYTAANAGYFKFASNGDLFVFFNGELVINLGGVHALQTKTLTLNNYGLQEGVSYALDVFMAQRHASTQSQFQLLTNIDPVSGQLAAPFCAAQTSRVGTAPTEDELADVSPAPVDGFPGVPGCNSVWEVHTGDSCSSIAVGSGLESSASVVSLNPGLDCSALSLGQLVCTGSDKSAACGYRVFTTGGSDTCLSIRTTFGNAGVDIPFSLFQALNFGIDCGSDGNQPLDAGMQICLPQIIGSDLSNPGTGRRLLAAALGLSNAGGSFMGDAWMASTSSHSAAQYALETPESTTFLHAAQQPMMESEFETTLVPARPSMRRLQQASSCIGNTFKVVQTACTLTCASVADSVGLTASQLVTLNPQLVNNAQGVCKVTVGQTLCRGCTGTICGISLSPTLADFLNFPNLQILLCGLLADCTNVAYLDGTPGAADETLSITLAGPTSSSSALTAAGSPQPAAFFASDGYYNTAPGSTLTVVIQPNFYDKLVVGISQSLVEWEADVVIADNSTAATGRRLQGFTLPGKKGYPKKAYKATSQNPKCKVSTYWRRVF